MHTSNDPIDPQDAYDSQRRRRTLAGVLVGAALLLVVAALHVAGVLPPGG